MRIVDFPIWAVHLSGCETIAHPKFGNWDKICIVLDSGIVLLAHDVARLSTARSAIDVDHALRYGLDADQHIGTAIAVDHALGHDLEGELHNGIAIVLFMLLGMVGMLMNIMAVT
jgi:hypothetical protein